MKNMSALSRPARAPFIAAVSAHTFFPRGTLPTPHRWRLAAVQHRVWPRRHMRSHEVAVRIGASFHSLTCVCSPLCSPCRAYCANSVRLSTRAPLSSSPLPITGHGTSETADAAADANAASMAHINEIFARYGIPSTDDHAAPAATTTVQPDGEAALDWSSLTPVILALLDVVLEDAERAHLQRRRQRQAQHTRRVASAPTATPSPPAPTTLYAHLLHHADADLCYASAPWLFRRLMRVAATFPAHHVCKARIASAYTWRDFAALLSTMDVYTITENGSTTRLDTRGEDDEGANEEVEDGEDGCDTSKETGISDEDQRVDCAGDTTTQKGRTEDEPAALTGVRDATEDFTARFWIICSPVSAAVLWLSGVGTGPSSVRASAPGAPAPLPSSALDVSTEVDARRFYVARRVPSRTVGETEETDLIPPVFRPCDPPAWRCPSMCPAPDATNNFNGWGSSLSIPRPEDIETILAYIPVNWGNLGTLAIPSDVRRRHMRSSSPLQWFRRQPFYFEVRDMNGTVEVRRSIALHPEAHGVTRDEALARLQLLMAERSMNHLVPLLPSGALAITTTSTRGAAAASTSWSEPTHEASASPDGGDASLPSSSLSSSAATQAIVPPAERAALKFFKRVCPPYFTTIALVAQRATKKTIDEAYLRHLAEAWPADFEVLHSRYSDVPLIRRRGLGADASRWRRDVIDDLERYPEDVAGLLAIMDCLSAIWDRPEYVFVRLSASAQRSVGGYEGMCAMMKRHPQLFRYGTHYVCRVDSSDPLSQQQPEPAVGGTLSRSHMREENPYLSPREVAKVFYYVAPDDEPFTPAFLVERASPAMQVALPPRVVTLLQLFPEWFACTETAPGAFTVHKIRPSRTQAQRDPTAAHDDDSSNGVKETQEEADEGEDHSWMRDAGAEEGILLGHSRDAVPAAGAGAGAALTRAATVEAVRVLIPGGGVDSTQLLLWAPLHVQRAASQYYGGVVKLVEAEKGVFSVEEAPDASKRIFLKPVDEVK